MENSFPNNNISKSSSQFIRGWSWGDMKMSSGQIDFYGEGAPWFSIPYHGISNVQQASSKNEIALEFNLDEENDDK